MEDKKYITILGDTWDQVAYKCYNDSTFINPLLDANRDKLKTVIFGAGIELKVPVVEVKSNANIAPWRR